MKIKLTIVFGCLLTSCISYGQAISLTTSGSAYTQNFDGLSNAAGSTTNNLTTAITGWSLTESGLGARDNELYGVDNGASTTGDMYSYGTTSATDRALGELRSGTLVPIFGASFTNNTGSTVTSLAISYTGEEWRLGTAGRTDQLSLEYSTNATDLVTGTWTNVSALNFVTPVTATAGAKDGNAAANRTALSSTITGLNIANGATFWIRWTDTDASGADDGLAVDDFSLTPTINTAPSFIGGGTQTITACQGAVTDISDLLQISDVDYGQTVTWSVTSAPANGSIVSGGTQLSNGSTVTPSGFSYQSGALYTGSDAFTIQASDGAGGTASTTINVTVIPSPTVTASATDTIVCAGQMMALTGNGADSYTWSDGILDNTAFTPTATTVYTVTGTAANGCTDTDTLRITLDIPNVQANTTANAVCDGDQVTLTGSGAVSYIWSNSVTDGVAFIPSSPNTYTVTGTDANGCSNTATVSVGVNTLPTVTANTTAGVVCDGDPVTLTGGGNATSYTWSNSVTDGVAFIPSSPNTYTVTGTDGNGCVNTATVSVDVNSLPAVVANTTASAICDGDPVTLTGSGAVSYTWSNSIDDGVAFNPSSPNTYTVTGTDGNGCVNTATVSVGVNALPNVTANTTTVTACAGDMITLTGGGATTYVWSNSVADGVAFTISSPNTYTVTGTDGNGCSNTATVSIAVNSLPNVTANTTTATVCSGDQVTLTGGGATSYVWSNSVTDGVAFVPSSPNTYTVTGTDANGCVNTATVSVGVNSLPTVTANTTASAVCAGNDVTLTAGGTATSFSWSDSVVSGVPFAPSSSNTYTVTGTDNNGCVNTATVSVGVNSLPVISVTNNGPYCISATIQLNATGGTNYDWTGPNGFTASLDNPTKANAQLADAGTYSVTVTDGNGCIASGSTDVIVNSFLMPGLSSNSPVCEGDVLNLTCSNGASWSWTGPNSFSDATQNPSLSSVTPAASGTYSVDVADANGCVGTGTISVTVNTLPNVTAVTNTATVCAGDMVILDASNASSYTWVAGTNPSTGASVLATPTVTTTYTVTGTDANGCVNTATVSVVVNSLPNVSANTSASVVCDGDQVTLTGSGDATSYAWSNSVTDGVAFTPASPNTYTVTGTDGNGCVNTATVSVGVNPLPATPGITQSGSVLTSDPASTYQWYLNGSALTGETSQTLNITQNGDYMVVITDNNSCGAISAVFSVTTLAVKNEWSLKDNFSFYPNPFATSGTIKINAGTEGYLLVEVYNSVGERVETICSKNVSAGQHLFSFNPSNENRAEGIYFIRATSNAKTAVLKVSQTK